MSSAQDWIKRLDLRAHPEGGWYREFYRAAESIPVEALPDRFNGIRAFSTAIYYLLNENDFSTLHRVKQDEVWHYYDGNALIIHMIDRKGKCSSAKLGKNAGAGEHLTVVVKAGWLFGAHVADPSEFVLAGCTVAPGFDFDDLEMPTRKQLLHEFPQHQDIIHRLTHSR